MATTLNIKDYRTILQETCDWLKAKPYSRERDYIIEFLGSQLRTGKICPECGSKEAAIFTADLDWCPVCKAQWPGG